ncbi:MAG: hypothetical protein ACLQFR_07610 [Streptosporangiaceae bacterium]
MTDQPRPCGHQQHKDCTEQCPCWAPGQGGKVALSWRGDPVAKPFPLSNVRVVRLYQARCPYCGWSSEIMGYADRLVVEADKRAHVAEHRRQEAVDG